MPAPSIGPTPAARMRELLEEALTCGTVGSIALMHRGARTPAGFEEAWQAAWDLMKAQKAYPHRTIPRHEWQEALSETRVEFYACYVGHPTPFQAVAEIMLRIVDASKAARRLGRGDESVHAELVA